MRASLVTAAGPWRQSFRLALGFIMAAATVSGATIGGAFVQPPASLGPRARSVLHQIMTSEQSWIRIHAAEALIGAGEGEAIRTYFLNELPRTESSAFRIGVYRVLATVSQSPEERSSWIAKVEHVYLDPTAPDQNQAIETLCKLGHRVSGETLAQVRRNAVGPPAAPMSLALWAGVIAGEPHSLDGLTALLTSDDPALRTGAAYALRWLHPANPGVRAALAQATAVEPPDTTPRAYLLGAALTVDADPAQTARWAGQLDQILLNPTAAAGARFEASWTLKDRYTVADLARLAPLLELPASENDTRIGAATIILTTLARAKSR